MSEYYINKQGDTMLHQPYKNSIMYRDVEQASLEQLENRLPYAKGAVEFSNKAEERQAKADYWAKRTDTINLSMPESIDFYEHKLEVAKEYHEGVKSGKYPRNHSYTLTYAKKDVNEAQKNYDLAVKLWGDV